MGIISRTNVKTAYYEINILSGVKENILLLESGENQESSLKARNNDDKVIRRQQNISEYDNEKGPRNNRIWIFPILGIKS